MAGSTTPINIQKVGNTIEIVNANTGSNPEYIPIDAIVSITPVSNDLTGDTGELQDVYPYDTMLVISIQHKGGGDRILKTDFDIQQVQNQAGWTADQAGLNQAASDIAGWL